MVSDNNQIKTEDTNSKITLTQFLAQENRLVAARNGKIFVSFNDNLCATIVAQKGSALNYESYFCNIVVLSIFLYYHEVKINIINIIQQGLRYHLDPI